MIQITYYPTPEATNLQSVNLPIKKKVSSVLKKWETENPKAILKYTKIID